MGPTLLLNWGASECQRGGYAFHLLLQAIRAAAAIPKRSLQLQDPMLLLLQVLVVRLLTAGSVEEHIVAVAGQKRKFADSSITGGLPATADAAAVLLLLLLLPVLPSAAAPAQLMSVPTVSTDGSWRTQFMLMVLCTASCDIAPANRLCKFAVLSSQPAMLA